MTFRHSRPFLGIATLALLAGCAGSMPGGDDALISLPSASPPPYAPPISESYVIQRAPVAVPLYAPAELFQSPPPFEVTLAEDARRQAEAQRFALAELQQRVEAQRLADIQRFRTVTPIPSAPAPFDDRANREAAARAEARAAAAEAEAADLAAKLAEARRAVAQAEAAALAAESAAQQAVRERVAQLAIERAGAENARNAPEGRRPVDRANPSLPPRPILGRFATRPAPPSAGTDPAPAARPSAPPATVATEPPAPRPVVERAPIPGLKPYILARSALPSAKPRRAPPTRGFGIGTPSPLSAPVLASAAPMDISTPSEPGGLSTRFFPTPGKPSTMGTDRDAQLDLASIDAVPYGVGADMREAVDGDSATAEWTDAVALIENGEVEALAIMEDADLVLTLCSGRDILTTPPDLAAAATLTAPQIICGQNKPLELR